jgi:hypothetical protein
MPSALTVLFGRNTFQRNVDLRRTEYFRLMTGVKVAGASGSSLRMQYSLDAGTTWKYFGRSAMFAEDGSVGQTLLTSTGVIDGGWIRVPQEAQIDNLPIRVVGINGNGTADPEFDFIETQWRA